MESLQTRMTELTVAIDEARALHEFREKQQVETLKNITEQLEEQTKLADEAEEELNIVKFDCYYYSQPLIVISVL